MQAAGGRKKTLSSSARNSVVSFELTHASRGGLTLLLPEVGNYTSKLVPVRQTLYCIVSGVKPKSM